MIRNELEEGVNTVMCTLKEAAERFMYKHEMMPCIFIDGVDLLATEDERHFYD